MNLVLLSAQPEQALWEIRESRQLQHLQQHLDLKVGDQLKVGIRQGKRYLTEVQAITAEQVLVKPIQELAIPDKLPVTLIVALPRPKVLRRLVMDSVTLGVEKLVLIHSYRVDKSYWQSPFLQQLDDYVTLGLEQAGDTIAPKIELYRRFKPFVEDVLSEWTMPESPSFVAHPYAQQGLPTVKTAHCQVLIGPEGGFIPYEVELLEKNGCQSFSLGNRILRTETAISYILGRLGI